MEPKTTVLITSAGSAPAVAVMAALREQSEVFVKEDTFRAIVPPLQTAAVAAAPLLKGAGATGR
jgi:hypothetical protein